MPGTLSVAFEFAESMNKGYVNSGPADKFPPIEFTHMWPDLEYRVIQYSLAVTTGALVQEAAITSALEQEVAITSALV